MSLLNLKKRMARKRRTFRNQEFEKFKQVPAAWRRPKGSHNKLRERRGGAREVNIGYGGPAEVRGWHPSGKPELLVAGFKDLEGAKDVVVRIRKGVGGRKRELIIKRAKELKLEVVNPQVRVKAPKQEQKKEVKAPLVEHTPTKRTSVTSRKKGGQ